MNCPECKTDEENLDWWIDMSGLWHWRCFECEHEWIAATERASIPCPSCFGWGTMDEDWRNGEPCPECGGAGEL